MSRTIKAVRRGQPNEVGVGEVEVQDSFTGTWVCRVARGSDGKYRLDAESWATGSDGMRPGRNLLIDLNRAVMELLESEQ